MCGNHFILFFLSSSGLHVLGGVASALLLPMDIYCVVTDSIALHKGEPEAYSKHLLNLKVEVLKSVEQLQEMLEPGLEFDIVELEEDGEEREI